MLLAILKSFLPGSSRADDPPRSSLPLEELDDPALMKRYAAGEAQAFAILVQRHQQGLYNFILRSCNHRDTADELLQEVFLRVVSAADRYEETAKFTTWIYRIARNICIDAARKDSRATLHSLQNPLGDDPDAQTHQDLLIDEDARSGSVDLDRQAFRDQLQRALERLPAEQREVFLLREITGLKFREIAAVLDIGIPTVKSRMRYALETLRGELAAFREHSFDDDDQAEMVPS